MAQVNIINTGGNLGTLKAQVKICVALDSNGFTTDKVAWETLRPIENIRNIANVVIALDDLGNSK